jgi:hypothetical protein
MRITWNASVVLAAALALSACRDAPSRNAAPKSAADVPTRPFDSLFASVGEVQLHPDAANPIGFAVSMAVSPSRIFIADPGQSDIKVFDRTSGALIRTIGRPGDDAGQFRTPAALVLVNPERLVVFDIGRHILSVWDTLGRLGYESRNTGFFTSLDPLPGTSRVLAGGYYTAGDKSSADTANQSTRLHEVDFLTGEVPASYLLKPLPSVHPWASTYSTPTGTLVGSVAVAGAMNSNVLWLHDRATGKESEIAVQAPWYHLPEYPAEYRTGGGSADEMQAMEEWSRKQYLMSGLIRLDEHRFLSQFVTRDSAGGRSYSYVVTDTDGTSWVSTGKTPVRIMAVKDSLAFGIRDSALLTLRIHPSVLRTTYREGTKSTRRNKEPPITFTE